MMLALLIMLQVPTDQTRSPIADQWLQIGTDADGARWMARGKDMRSIRSGAVWVKIDASKAPAHKWRSAMHRFYLDCDAETTRVTSYVTYGPNGSVVDSWTGYEAPKPAAPESMAAAILRELCQTK